MVQQKFARAIRLGIGSVAVAVGGDVKGVEPSLPVFNAAVGVGQVASAGPDGFDLGTRQNDTRLNRLGDGVVVTRLAVMDFDRFQGA